MEHILEHKILTLPLFIWVLQIIYVALALSLFLLLRARLQGRTSSLHFQVVFVLVMLGVNIAWRMAIRRLRPNWF